MVENLKWGVAGASAISPFRFQQRSWGYDTSFPATWPVNAWFFRTDLDTPYQNTGTLDSPVFTARGGSSDHEHSATAGDGGVLDANDTQVTLFGVQKPLLEVMAM